VGKDSPVTKHPEVLADIVSKVKTAPLQYFKILDPFKIVATHI
jgi:hypothetical protein